MPPPPPHFLNIPFKICYPPTQDPQTSTDVSKQNINKAKETLTSFGYLPTIKFFMTKCQGLPPERKPLAKGSRGQTLAHVPYGHRACMMIMGKATSCTGLSSDPKDGSRRKLTYVAPGRLARMPAGGIHDENCMDHGAFPASVHVFFRCGAFFGEGSGRRGSTS